MNISLPSSWLLQWDVGGTPVNPAVLDLIGGEAHIAFVAMDPSSWSSGKVPPMVAAYVHELPGTITLEGYVSALAKSLEQTVRGEPIKRRRVQLGGRAAEELRYATEFGEGESGSPGNIAWNLATTYRANATLSVILDGEIAYWLMGFLPTDAGADMVARMDKVAQSFRIGIPSAMLPVDEFSSATNGYFRDGQKGVGTVKLSGGGSHQYQWGYGYSSGTLLAQVQGPYPKSGYRGAYGYSADCRERIPGAFAVEFKVRAAKSVKQALYGLRLEEYSVDSGSFYVLLEPGAGTFDVEYLYDDWEELDYGKDSAIQRDFAENAVRVELRPGSLAVKVNGKAVSTVRHADIVARSTKLSLAFWLTGPPDDSLLEVRFSSFRVLPLEQ